MLSHHDRRRLQEIEHRLELTDPELARGMRQAWSRPRAWPFVVLASAGGLLALLGLVVLSMPVGLLGVSCLVGGILAVRKRCARRDQQQLE